eukprot:COSAG02_NODE_1009_length_15234_cov_9.594423_4_plen_148_part_00
MPSRPWSARALILAAAAAAAVRTATLAGRRCQRTLPADGHLWALPLRRRPTMRLKPFNMDQNTVGLPTISRSSARICDLVLSLSARCFGAVGCQLPDASWLSAAPRRRGRRRRRQMQRCSAHSWCGRVAPIWSCKAVLRNESSDSWR